MKWGVSTTQTLQARIADQLPHLFALDKILKDLLRTLIDDPITAYPIQPDSALQALVDEQSAAVCKQQCVATLTAHPQSICAVLQRRPEYQQGTTATPATSCRFELIYSLRYLFGAWLCHVPSSASGVLAAKIGRSGVELTSYTRTTSKRTASNPPTFYKPLLHTHCNGTYTSSIWAKWTQRSTVEEQRKTRLQTHMRPPCQIWRRKTQGRRKVSMSGSHSHMPCTGVIACSAHSNSSYSNCAASHACSTPNKNPTRGSLWITPCCHNPALVGSSADTFVHASQASLCVRTYDTSETGTGCPTLRK